MRPQPRPALHCRHCGNKYLLTHESAQKLFPRLIRVSEGTLWVQCPNRRCGQWGPAPEPFLALLRVVVEPRAPVGCLHDAT